MLSPHRKLRIVVGGMVGQFPLGGVAWDYFHYVLGLADLGHDVVYHEDTWVWPFDPIHREPVDKPDYTVKFLGDFLRTYAPQIADRFHYVLLHDQHFGMTREAFTEFAKTADIFLNVSGACLIPDELPASCIKVFLDTDPGYNQIMLHEKFSWSANVEKWCKTVAAHDRFFTYAENMGAPDCRIPQAGHQWIPTRCVVTLPQWQTVRDAPVAANANMTTVMTWDWFKGILSHDGVEYSTKVVEYNKFHDLPRRTPVPLALVVGGVKTPRGALEKDGWSIIDAYQATLTPQSYQDLIATSAGEWSVAKNVYVATRSGWFSCRTACYLAGARPAVVQDTAWSKFLPTGSGLFAFETIEQAIAALETVAADPAKHRHAAYEIAREYLAPDRVLTQMLDDIAHPPAPKSATPATAATPSPTSERV